MKFRILTLIALVSSAGVNGWSTLSISKPTCPSAVRRIPYQVPHVIAPKTSLRSSSLSSSETPTSSSSEAQFSDDERKLVESLYGQTSDSVPLKQVLSKFLPSASPITVVKLRQSENHSEENIRNIAKAINEILDEELRSAKETLQELLNAGEIRKLDALIGKAARSGKLDAAFFNVLAMNLQDAAAAEQAGSGGENEASRVQILRHVFTRCQEEVEKSVPPAAALLNKLLRTEQESIRANLYKHYLTPQPRTIKTPDGKEIELKGEAPVLVPIGDFVKAVETTVMQIRTVEKAGATDRVSAAAMVESCRQVAKEARIIIGESYGRDSEELNAYEDGLQPVFRPSSPNSPFIQGQT